jgi:hypothetical protein
VRAKTELFHFTEEIKDGSRKALLAAAKQCSTLPLLFFEMGDKLAL